MSGGTVSDLSSRKNLEIIAKEISKIKSSTKANSCQSEDLSRLYLSQSLLLKNCGALEDSLSSIAQALSLSPYRQNIIQVLCDILEAKASRPAANIGLIISCEKFISRAERVAKMLSHPAIPFKVKIVVGANAAVDNINNLIKVQAKDTYEALPDKVSSAFMAIASNYAAPTNIFKIDDDVHISDIELFSSSCTSLISSNIDYAGFPVGDPYHNRTWHWNKCSEEKLNRFVYSKRFNGVWAQGPFYYLSAQALRAFVIARYQFPGELAGELFEDKFVGDVLRLANINLTSLKLKAFAIETDNINTKFYN